MPAVRPNTSLSSRRNVGLQITTSIPSEVTDVIIEATDEERGRSTQRTSNTGRTGIRTAVRTPKSPKLKKSFAPLRNPNRSRSPAKRPSATSPLPPRTADKKFFLDFDEPKSSPADEASNLQDLHEIVPGVFLAIGNVNLYDKFEYSVPLYDDFTHLVRIGYDEDRHTWFEEDETHEVMNLSIEGPPPRPLMRSKKAGRRTIRNTGMEIPRKRKVITDLGSRQLTRARNFLHLALPYFEEANPPLKPREKISEPSKVLIIAPDHVDAMSIFVAYLSYCSGEHPFRVIKCIDIDENVPDAWKNIFPIIRQPSEDDPDTYYGEGAERIDWVSRRDT